MLYFLSIFFYLQLSDEEKNDIPEHIKKAAREMGQKAFKERLKEIQMSEYDAKLYNEFSSSVQNQVPWLCRNNKTTNIT